MSSLIAPVPIDKIEETHNWREWFTRVYNYIKSVSDFTTTTTVGNVTNNSRAGQVIMAAGGTTLTLTNNLITTSSGVLLTFAGNPGVAVSLYAVVATGSCSIKTTAAITNQTLINYRIEG